MKNLIAILAVFTGAVYYRVAKVNYDTIQRFIKAQKVSENSKEM